MPNEDWAATMAVVHCSVAVPTEDAARSVADALKTRGHRWITMISLDELTRLPKADHLRQRTAEFTDPGLAGWWHVGSLVDEQAPAGTDFGFIDIQAEYFQQECERAAVEALAGSHGGFAGAGWTSLRDATFPGPAPYAPKPELFDLNGLVHQPTRDEAQAIRRSLIAGFPTRPEMPASGAKLTHGDGKRTYPPLLAGIQQVAGSLPVGEAPPTKPWEAVQSGGIVAAWRAAEADDFEDEGDIGFWLQQAAVYQGACSPHSVEAIPLLVGIANHDDVRPKQRVRCLIHLYEAATLGARRAATEAGRRHALGTPMSESADEQAVRLAVEAAAPALFERWDQEGEAGQFVRAALAAACPSAAAASGVVERVRGLADRWPEQPRVEAMRFALALAEDEPEEVAAVLDAYRGRGDLRPREVPSPYAPACGALLELVWERVRAV
jgi:hypothetical protein